MKMRVHDALILAVSALVTIGLRFAPFFLFRGRKEIPKLLGYLGRVLPYAAMAMLVVYCLKDTSFALAGGWIPQLISSALVVALYVWKRNAMVSIVAGTVCNMLLVQLVF